MKTMYTKNLLVIIFLIIAASSANAQLRYRSNGTLTMGTVDPYKHYTVTLKSNGTYITDGASKFFQIDCTPAATRLASHLDQVVFFNTQTSQYNSIQVKNVYNYSDARAKTNIQSLTNGLGIISKLNVVNYDFIDKDAKAATTFKVGGTGKEIGLLAQDVEKILPNAVLTDPDGNKLINYNALFNVAIQAIKELQQEVNALKAGK